ncbi:unnamed protein product, partial [Owenia fusiformis]
YLIFFRFKMNCAVIHKPRQLLVLKNRPIPEIPPIGLLIRTLYAGVCHSDIHFQDDKPDKGVVMGHEISGLIQAFGEDVQGSKSGLAIGDKVCIHPWIGCQKCPLCKADKANQCEHNPKGAMDIGQGPAGGFSNHVVVPHFKFAVKVPEAIPMDLAALIPCSGVTAYAALSKVKSAIEEAGKLYPFSRLLVIGVGGVGIWAVSIANSVFPYNTKIIAADLNKEKLHYALKIGASDTIPWSKDQSKEDLVAMTTASGKMDAVIDFVGSETTSHTGIYTLRKGGVYVPIGLFGGELQLPVSKIISDSIKIEGSRTGNLRQLKAMLNLMEEKKVPYPPRGYYKLEEINNVMDNLRDCNVMFRALIKFDVQA